MVKGEFSGQILGRAGAGSKIYDFEGMTGPLYTTIPRNDGRGFYATQGREFQGGVPGGLDGGVR